MGWFWTFITIWAVAWCLAVLVGKWIARNNEARKDD